MVTDENDEWAIFEPQLGNAALSLQKVPEENTTKNRAHPDLRMADFENGIQKLKQLGATEIQTISSGDLTWVVMADPEGNEFCAIK